MGCSLIHSSPTDCGVSECDRETSYRRPKPTGAVELYKKFYHFCLYVLCLYCLYGLCLYYLSTEDVMC